LGNEHAVEGTIAAKWRFYVGYSIAPSSEARERSHATDDLESYQLLMYHGNVDLVKKLSQWVHFIFLCGFIFFR
jgi:hypothetical protein